MYVVDCLCVNVSRGLKPVARPFPGFSDLLLLFRKMSGTQECKLVAAIMGKIEHEAHEYERRIEDLHKRICQLQMDPGIEASTVLLSDIHLHRAIRDHFQLKDDEQVDFEMFNNLVRKIMSLSHAFTGMETIESVTLEQANLLLTHEWPSGGAKISRGPNQVEMIKDLLGKGKKQEEKVKWESPFGTHFPDPKKKKNYDFYHNANFKDDDANEDTPEPTQDTDGLMQAKRLELQELVLRLLKAGVISIPFLVWDPESVDKRERDAIRRLGTIFGAYQVQTWFWELVEMLRKFMMVGLLVFISPGEPAQLGVALLITLFFLFAHLILQPFCTPDLNQMQAVSQASLALTLFVGLMTIIDAYIKTEADLAASGPWGLEIKDPVQEMNRLIFSLFAVCVNFTTMALPPLLMMKNLRERMPNIRDVPRLIRKNVAETKETIRTQVHSVLLMLGIVHDAPAAGPDETSKDSSLVASGLSWEEIGKPEQGTEISNHALAAALKKRTTFTQAEWDKFKVANLFVDSFIKVGDRYTTRCVLLCFHVRVGHHVSPWDLPERLIRSIPYCQTGLTRCSAC
jgi:hypothetical protein